MTPQRDNKKQGGTARLTRLALLTAIALTIFMAEAQLPTLVPIQGVKLGLANIVTVYAVFALGPGDALLILLSRVFLGAVFSGQMMTLFYSLGGGLLAWLIMCLLRPVFHKEHLWLCSPVAALFHNLGQLLVAAAIMRTWAVLAYLPKATVQAAIGSVPLAMGLPCGGIVLSTAVLAILITAPLGALGMDAACGRLRTRGP